MKFKPKGWLWKLTYPFAHNNFTTIYGTIYHPSGIEPSPNIVRHEQIHFEQQKRWTILGLPIWLNIYLGSPYTLLVTILVWIFGPWQEALMLSSNILIFGLPVLYNPLRKKWELEAYIKGSGYSEEQARAILKTKMYGWLL